MPRVTIKETSILDPMFREPPSRPYQPEGDWVEMRGRKWRRTDLTGADGSPVPDDWSLVDEKLGPIARLYRMSGGPQGGKWFWTVLIDAEGRPYNSGTGTCDSGGEARNEVERKLFEMI